MVAAIVLAGGAGRRLGGVDKPAVTLGGISLLNRVLAALNGIDTVVVGPRRTTTHEVTWCREHPPGAGPVAAVRAGLEQVSDDTVLLLAADLPDIAPAIPVLLGALTSRVDTAALVDDDGRRNYLAAAWRTAGLRTAVTGVPDDAPLRTLYRGAVVHDVLDPGWGRDCDTPDDLARLRERIEGDGR